MHYFTLTSGKNVYTALSLTEAQELQSRVGGKIEHQFCS
jgi:hypothetical protein